MHLRHIYRTRRLRRGPQHPVHSVRNLATYSLHGPDPPVRSTRVLHMPWMPGKPLECGTEKKRVTHVFCAQGDAGCSEQWQR